MFLPWTCGYRRGATAIAVALEDDPRSSLGTAEVLKETIDSRGRWTIDYDHCINVLERRMIDYDHCINVLERWMIDYYHYIDALFVGPGCSNSSSAALRVEW